MVNILFVDDNPDDPRLNITVPKNSEVSTVALHPEDVEIEDLTQADLVLVDYQLDDAKWPARHMGPVARQPRDGLALATLLRRHVHDKDSSPTAFAILSAEVQALAQPLPPDNRAHVLARLNSLEWVFQKQGKKLDEQVVELAQAVAQLPAKWPKDNAEEAARLLMKVLGLDDQDDDHEQLLDDVTACLPPIHELSEWSHGLAVIRWLLHRILPYPCFLWDSHHLAARLRVDHRWLEETVISNTDFGRWLSGATYDGMLSTFAGRRWWRSRVEQLLWDGTDKQSFEANSVFNLVNEKAGGSAKRSFPPSNPIVCVNGDFEALDKFFERQECVRIRPDDWPAFADQAWTAIETVVSDAGLMAIVVNEDQEKLNARE
jgi:hypothetical protein